MTSLHQHMTISAGGTGAGVAVSGEVDASNAGSLRLAIIDAAGSEIAKLNERAKLRVDLAGVTFMDSSGIRAIEDASLALAPSGFALVLCNVPRQVMRILGITAIGASLEISA
jgi:anti-sigma B factor antagonist